MYRAKIVYKSRCENGTVDIFPVVYMDCPDERTADWFISAVETLSHFPPFSREGFEITMEKVDIKSKQIYIKEA